MKKNVQVIMFVVGVMAVGVVNGLFGGGGGLVAILIVKSILKFEDKMAHATTIIAMGLVSLPTLVTYCITIKCDYLVVLFVSLGMILGAIIGSAILKKISPKLLNVLLILVMLASGIKCFF